MSVWYKRQRNIPERPWFKDGAVLQVFDYLEALAYVSDGRYKGVIIRQGSCLTTRADIVEATGLSYKTVDRCLKKLVANGDIIVKGNSFGSVITICNYGGFINDESLFGTTNDTTADTPNDTTSDTTADTTHLSYIEGRYKDNIITPYSRYNKEREKDGAAYEIKKKYNKVFEGKLPPCIRLSLTTKIMVEECLRRFGMQTVDMVFEQILAEPFSLGQNKTGFIANFQYIFTPKNFQQYLERWQLARKKQPQQTTMSVGTIREEITNPRQSREEYEQVMREAAAKDPNGLPARIVAQWDKNKEQQPTTRI